MANKMLIIARTTPKEQTKRPVDGLTLFYTDLDRSRITVRAIDKMGRKCVDSNELFIDQLEVPVEDRIGAEGEGFKCLLHGLNPERIFAAACALGLGRAALERAAPTHSSASCSTARSARTRACSTRWPSTGSSWRLPSC